MGRLDPEENKRQKTIVATASDPSSDAIASNTTMPDIDTGLSTHDQADAKKAAAIAKRAATVATKKASTEEADKAKCLLAMKARSQAQIMTNKEQLLQSPPQRPTVADNAITVHPGDCVDVLPDLSAHNCDYGGKAWVVATKEEGESLTLMAKVKYVVARTAKWVPAARITRILPYEGAQGGRACRERAAAAAAAAATALPSQPPTVVRPLLEALAEGVRRRRPKGWRKMEMVGKELKQRMNDKEKMLCGAECRKLEAHIAKVDAVEAQRWMRGENKGQFRKAKKKNSLTKKYLAFAWGVGRSSLDGCAEASQRRWSNGDDCKYQMHRNQIKSSLLPCPPCCTMHAHAGTHAPNQPTNNHARACFSHKGQGRTPPWPSCQDCSKLYP